MHAKPYVLEYSLTYGLKYGLMYSSIPLRQAVIWQLTTESGNGHLASGLSNQGCCSQQDSELVRFVYLASELGK